MIYSKTIASPCGKITLVSSDKALIGVYLSSQMNALKMLSTAAMEKESSLPILLKTEDWLKDYFNHARPPLSEIPLSPQGSDFQKIVWQILCTIPYGETVSYGEIAKEAAKALHREEMSAQAIGGAVGKNPIAIIIPCHRVMGKNGNLTGYGGGLDLKLKLLIHEGVDTSRFFLPKK